MISDANCLKVVDNYRNRTLRMERDFLKKAAVFFAADDDRRTS